MFGIGNPELVMLIVIILGFIVISKLSNLGSVAMLCPNCGTKARPRRHTKGSIFIEIILWICFIIPGLIYSIWRLTTRQKVCPVCHSPNMIPLDSPRAQQILNDQ
jgi:ssDNA-binding Zn-finger/Zn-ribbon topoisomerase 1